MIRRTPRAAVGPLVALECAPRPRRAEAPCPPPEVDLAELAVRAASAILLGTWEQWPERVRDIVRGLIRTGTRADDTAAFRGAPARVYPPARSPEVSPTKENDVQAYDATLPQMSKMLSNLSRCLDKAVAYAEAKKFDPAVLLTARLAPDQYPLLRQVQIACDAAKAAAANLSGRVPPVHPDTEQTMDQLRTRIHTCLAYLETITPADFKDAETRMVSISFLPGKVISGLDYLNELALPNFYFHMTTAYAILRHNGVDLGKSDFIGTLKLRDA